MEEKQVTRYLARNTLATSAWNISNLTIARVYGGNDAAVLLHNLIAKDEYFEKNNAKYDGWFFNTADNLEEDTAISHYTQRRILTLFENTKLLKTKLKGTPAKKHFKIDYFALEVLLSLSSKETKELDVKVLNILLLRNCTYINKIKHNKIKVKEENKQNKKLIDSSNKYFKLASKLSKIIQKTKNVKHTTRQLNNWAKEFQKLEKENGVSIKRQKTALTWYGEEEKSKFSLVIESGTSFREKFIRLESAIERKNLPNNSSNERTSGYRRKDGHKYKSHDVIL